MLDDASDHVHPILVREVRRALRGNFLPAALVNAQVLLLLVCLPSGKGDGRDILMGLLWILGLLGGIVVPVMGLGWIWEERRSGTLPVLLVTQLGLGSLFRGRLAAGILPMALVSSTAAPFAVFAYLLGGVDVSGLALTFGVVLLLSIFHLVCAIALAFAPRTRVAYASLWWIFAAFVSVSTASLIGCAGQALASDPDLPGLAWGVACVGLVVAGVAIAWSHAPSRGSSRVWPEPGRDPGPVSVHRLSRAFGGRWAVRELTFQLDPGEIVGLIGSNGAGKSTTLRMMATLDRPTRGDVGYADRVGDVGDWHSAANDPGPVRARLGYMPDRQGFYANTTVREYLDFFARAYRIRGAARRRLVEEVLAFAGLAAMAGRLTTELSKGMRQRLSFARAIVHDPSVLLLDEPMEGLDPRARIEFRELLRALAAQGKTILISSHVLAELGGLVDRVVILEKGELAATGRTEDLVREVSAARAVRLRLRAGQDSGAVERHLVAQPGVLEVRVEGLDVTLSLDGVDGEVDRLVHDLYAAGFRLEEIESRRPDLETVFLHHTRGDLA